MKRLSIICLSILLALSLSVTAWATNGQAKGQGLGTTTSIPVSATYRESSDGGTVYSVDIIWGSMDFTYQTAGKHWDPASHEYITTDAGWTCADGADQIKITNHSNAEVNCSLSYTANTENTDYSGISGTFMLDGAKSSYILLPSAAADKVAASSLSTIFSLKLDGNLPKGTSSQEIGTITVTISKA